MIEDETRRVCECLYHYGEGQDDIIERQIKQRFELVEFWGIDPGWRILEVGCGEGMTTVALAHAVGKEGGVVAVDLDGPGEWEDPTLGELVAAVEGSWLGDRIEFRLGADLLDPSIDSVDEFDLAVFNQCSWYMPGVSVLKDLFRQVRPSSRRLGFHEWNPVPYAIDQIPHLLSALIQARLKAIDASDVLGNRGNVWTIISPADAKKAAVDTNWNVTAELELASSQEMEDGINWEPAMAQKYASDFLRRPGALPTEAAEELLRTEIRLLGDSGYTRDERYDSPYVYARDSRGRWLKSELGPPMDDSFVKTPIP